MFGRHKPRVVRTRTEVRHGNNGKSCGTMPNCATYYAPQRDNRCLVPVFTQWGKFLQKGCKEGSHLRVVWRKEKGEGIHLPSCFSPPNSPLIEIHTRRYSHPLSGGYDQALPWVHRKPDPVPHSEVFNGVPSVEATCCERATEERRKEGERRR